MNRSTATFIAFLYCALLIWYSYMEMTALEMATIASSALAISKVTVIIISLFLLFIKKGVNYKTRFTHYWYAWIIFLLFEFLLYLVKNGIGISFMHNFFAPCCFLLAFCLCLINKHAERPLIIGFVLLFLFNGGYALYLSFTYNIITIENGHFVSNLVFWALSSFMFVTLVKKKVLKYLLFIPMIIIALLLAKRSALIVLFLEVLVFSLSQLRNSKRRGGIWSLILYVIIGIMAFGLVSSRFSQFADTSFSRFETMQEDKGSGRFQIYEVAFNKIDDFNIGEVLFGRGYSSFLETGHSNAHNDALQLFYEYGMCGLSFYVVLLIILFRRIKTVKKRAEDYYVGYLFCVITIFVLGMFSNLIPFNSYFAFLCSYLGMTEAAIYTRSHIKNNIVIEKNN